MQAGARALLFDRLVDLDPDTAAEPLPLRVFKRQELRESVRREVGRLLNTRCSIPAHRFDDRVRTVLDYGVPDVSSLSPQSPTDQRLLARILSQAIETFEPRLRNVQVTAERFVDSHKALLVRIDAQLVVETITEPVSFPVLIRNSNGEADVHATERAD